ncbi:MAG: hypothetical protein ACOY3Z_03380 [Thermodesulfobacteriota bacterium]
MGRVLLGWGCMSVGLLMGLASQAAAANLVGSMIGDVGGWVTDANGQQVAPQGAVSGDVAISTDSQGNVVATVTGTASCTGGLGVHINYAVSYNAATGVLTGTYTDPANATARDIQFSHQGGLQWQASVADSVVVDGASRPYNIAVALELPETSLYSGTQFPADRQLSGPLSTTMNLSVPIVMPQFGLNETIDTTLTVTGEWVATVVPGADGSATITGHASGTYSSSAISFTVTYMGISVPVSFSLNGNYGGSLFQEGGELFFGGTFGESLHTSGVDVVYSGDMLIDVPVDTTGMISQLPFSFDGSPRVEVGSFGTFTVPVTVSGVFPFALN